MKIRSIVLLVHIAGCSAFPRINLFRPSDRPLMPEPILCYGEWGSQLSVGYEGAFHIRAFRDTEEYEQQIDIERLPSRDKKTCLFSLFQDSQSALAALKGSNSDTKPGALSQQFNRDDQAARNGRFLPTGTLHVPMNLLFAQRFYLSHGLSLGLYLPVIHAELTDVCWHPVREPATSEQVLGKDLIPKLEEVAGLKLGGWKRTGVGDLVIQADWMRDFPQCRSILSNVRTMMRLGVICPTGKRADEDRLLAFPFGSDGAWGLQFAGGIDFSLWYTLRAGIDVQFEYLFGNTRCRRIKTAADQTDLLLSQTARAYREHGLGQQYNIYLESCNVWKNTSFKINYQLLKQNDDRLDIGSDRIDTRVANSAESLFDWTAHSLIFMVRHDLWKDYESSLVYPSFLGWIKWGFNGKRALLANTIGIQFNLAF